LTTSWTWDTATNGKGKLQSLTSPDAVKTYFYNSKSQLEKLMLTTNGDSFVASWTYDDFGRSKTLHYPQPIGETPLELTREYDAHGFVVGVRDAATKYWELADVDTSGRYKTEVLGKGLTTTREYHQEKQVLRSIASTLGGLTIQQLVYNYDGLLNLKSRTDHLQGQNKTERFRYDPLNRITCAYFSATESSAAMCAQSFAYTANGNLTSKSDVGTLLYADVKHPHAVTNAQGEAFSYDNVGNQITRPGGIFITYTPFDLPSRITQGANVVSFGYDGDEQRIRKTTPTSETLYFEDLFEQVTVGNGKAFRYYVHSPERVIAVVTHGGDDPGTKWLSVDNLGSVESVTNDLGQVVEKRSYDVFGAKRNPKWGDPGGTANSKVTKGFTGHEEDEEFGLVNMRGRLYDPRVARFTTPDPIIANIYDGQSLNGFSYVWNNPLTFVDPSGFLPQAPNEADLPHIKLYAEAKRDANGKFYLEFYDPNKPGQKLGDISAAIGAAASTADTSTTGGVTGVASDAILAGEGFGSFMEGLVKGNLSDNDSWSATLGSVVGGLIPGVGLVADIRDLGAAVAHIAEGRDGAWLEMGAAVIGFVPGGDIAKGIAKSATKATTKAATRVGVELVDDAAKVLKGSTATAADGLTSAQKTAGKVNAPRGPPAKRPGNRGHADHQADVKGGGRDQAERLMRPGEELRSEKEVRGHPGINRRADNQIIGTDGRTRVVVESERRPGGAYHKRRVRELEAAGIEVHTRPPSQWGK
jgi:RHS repeat-associated protein